MRTVAARRALALTVAAVLAGVMLVACGDDEESSTPTTAQATTTTLSQVELDKQKAQRVVLTATDVPGFTQDPPDADDENVELDAAANACVNNNPLLVRLGEDNDPRGAASPDFSQDISATQTASVSSSATFAENDEEARTALTAASAASFPGCFSNALATALRSDPDFTNVTVSTARLPNLNAGDQSVGWRSTARARVSGQNLTFYFDFTFIRSGRGVAVLSGLGVSAPFPEGERGRLASVLAGRMAG